MNRPVVEVKIRAIVQTPAGRGIFLGDDTKVFCIFVDDMVGTAIQMFAAQTPKERPLTHDLLVLVLKALGARVERVIINDVKNQVYFARLIIVAENEIHDRKIIELDARPSDSIALAVQAGAPIYVSREVWDEVEDKTEQLREIEEKGGKEEE